MSSYNQPRGLNPVSVVIYVMLAGAAYGAVMFGPAYWRKWKVREILDDTAVRYLSRRMIPDDAKKALAKELQVEVAQRVHALGIVDPKLEVEVVSQPPDAVTVSARYEETIQHPVIKKVTLLHFRPFINRRAAASE